MENDLTYDDIDGGEEEAEEVPFFCFCFEKGKPANKQTRKHEPSALVRGSKVKPSSVRLEADTVGTPLGVVNTSSCGSESGTML